jgi:rhodanese-related sulfurtransferase
LDVRAEDEFVKGHVPRAIFIGLNGDFAPWVGALIADVQQPILLVSPEGRAEETVTRLSRVGFDNTLGFLEGGIEAWRDAGKEVDTIASFSAEQIEKLAAEHPIPIFDVRKESEFDSEHVVDAKNTPLNSLNDYLTEFPGRETFYLHCAGGYRSVIAASILKSRGIHNLVDIAGGFGALRETGMELTDYVCPTSG